MMDDDFVPKELLEVNWRSKLEDTDEFLNEEYWRKHSSSHKILCDEFGPVWSSDSDEKIPSKPMDMSKKKKWKWNKTQYKPFTGYPRPSTLTATEQEVFLALMKKFNNEHSPFLSPQEKQELQTFTVLQEKVNKEQADYQIFLRDYALANQSRYLSINPGIRKYINELWKSHLQIPLRYPQFYETYRTVPLAFGDIKCGVDLLPDEISLQLGIVDRLNTVKHYPNIVTNYSVFVAMHPIVSQTEDSVSNRIYPVSQDKNADYLARVTNAEFVVSSSGIKKICDNHGPLFLKSWEIPVTVKECEVEENGRTKIKRIVFIDKALPRKKMTVVDKINWYHKIAIKSALVRTNHAAAYRLHKPKITAKSSSDDDFLLTEDDNETFGIDAPTSSKKTGVRNIRSEEKTEVDTEEDEQPAKIDKDASSSNLSDSEEDNLVIEEDSNEQESKGILHSTSEVCKKGVKNDLSSNTTVVSPKSTPTPKRTHSTTKSSSATPKSTPITSPSIPNKSSDSEESNKKPLTRSMAKMLENLNKVEKLVGNKQSDVAGNSSVVRKLTMDERTDSESAVSLQKEKDKADQEGESAVSPQKERDKTEQKPNDKEGKKEVVASASAKSKKNPRGRYPIKAQILDQLLKDQSSLFGDDQKKKDAYQSREKRRLRRIPLPEDFDPVLPPEGTNLIYRTFNLTRKSHNGSPFKILLRCKYDGTEFVGRTRMATIVPKVEFQPEFGAETITMSELTQHWISLLIKPNSVLVRARIDAFSGKILMIEKKEIKDLSREERRLNVQASSCLNPLYSVLRGIADIPPGQYVLSHDSKLGAFARLYHAIEIPRDGSYDLHKQYDVDPTVEEPQSIANLWIPLDCGVITPIHESTNRVPGTFNPGTNKKGIKKKPKRKR